MPTQVQSEKFQNNKGHIVLVIEHETPLGEMLLRMLKDSGYTCHFIQDEQNSLDVIREIKPDLVILDMSWPNIDGYEILEAKRADRSVASIPVIALSTEPEFFDNKRAAALGVSDQVVEELIKPEEVVAKIDKHFSKPASAQVSHVSPLQATAPTSSIIQHKKILWVEDDKFLGNILKKRMGKTGCDMFLAKNGEEALAYLAKEVPHIIVLDLMLPGMSGFDILRTIRNNQALSRVPVLVLSNLNQTGDIERAKILGAAKYLVKAAVSLDEIAREVEMLAV